MSRVVTRRGMPRGCLSRSFSSSDLLNFARQNTSDCIYVEMEESGWMSSEGYEKDPGGSSGLAAAAAAAAARLAPDVHARTCELAAAAAAAGDALRVRLLADLAPGAELLLWFDETVLASIDMPFLTLRNIRGKKDYVCHNCEVQFEHPNHLKVHLFLDCREYAPSIFWKRFHARLSATSAAKVLLSTDIARLSAFRPYADVAAPAATAPAQLEALAAEWGRSREGHLCLYCGKLYSRKYGLKIHIRTHTGYKPLRCRYCLRAFGDPSNLNKHVRLHAASGTSGAGSGGERGERGEHACAVCGKRLARRRDLLRHLRARHAAAAAAAATPAPTPAPSARCALP